MISEKSNPLQPPTKTGLILLSGFLGAGKTTLLKHVLSWKRDMSDTVVIVNEFGDVGIDGALLQGESSDIIELTSGCICCTLVLDLTITLKNIWARRQPRWIIVEASGLSDPKAVVAAFDTEGLRERIGLLQTISVLDAEIWQMREVMGPVFYHQLETANLVLLNKIDRLDKNHLKQVVEEVRHFLPGTRIIPTVQCNIDRESLFNIPNLKNGQEKIRHEHTHHHSDFESGSFVSSHALDEVLFREFINRLPKSIFRVKGIVRFPGHSEILNFVGGQTDWSQWEGEPQTQLVFIGIDEHELREVVGALDRLAIS